MIKTYLMHSAIFAIIALAYGNINAQEFPVAVGTDSTLSCGAVYGGENGIVAVQGDTNSQYSINAQLVAAGGVLIGSRISLGAYGVPPGAIPTFDGTNYFFIWREFNGNLKGQFINTSGGLVGTSFTIATDVSIQRGGSYGMAIADTVFFVVFTKTNDVLYGQFVGFSGNLIGGQITISSNYARELSVAYDGTNFLVDWVEIIPDTDKDIYGQFVSKTGSLVGSNFLIDGGPNYSDNPTSLAFDGTRYLLVYHDQPPASGKWFIKGRFITTTGTLQESITICDTSLSPTIACVAFDNTNYFVTWAQQTDMSMRGRFFNRSGVPVDTSFVVLAPEPNKIPIGGVGFGGGLYLVVGAKVNSNFTDGDVYARFVSPLTTGVENKANLAPDRFALNQNYPNPFNPKTVISYHLPAGQAGLPLTSKINIKVYNLLGREVATLFEGTRQAGTYEAIFDGSGLASGIYFYKLSAGAYSQTKKLILLK